jgi:diamine N-acetyltransferase
MNEIQIRNAKINDAQLICNLGRQTQLETFLKDNIPAVMNAYIEATFNKEIIEKELNDGNCKYFIVEKGNLAIGYSKLRLDNKDENILAGPNAIELQRIYIIANEKGNGYGKIQLNFCENIAKSMGYDIIWLGVWEKNLYAMEFYKRNGYQLFSKHGFDFGGEIQNDFMMKKSLD